MLSFISSTFFYSILIIIPSILIVLIHGDNIFEKKLFYFLYKKSFITDFIQKKATENGLLEKEIIEIETQNSRIFGEYDGPPPSKRISNKNNQASIKNLDLILNRIPNWKDLIKNEIENLKNGQILFNPPNEMKAGTRNRVVVRISQDKSFDLSKNLKGNSVPLIEGLKIGGLMQVYLFSYDFSIKTLNLESQVIMPTGFTEWAWDVTPIKSGNLDLILRITVQLQFPYGVEKKDYPLMEKTIKVNSNPVYSAKIFLQENWKWVITALILPLIGWSVKMILG